MNRPTYAEACRTFRWEDSFKPGRAVYPGLEAEIVDLVKTHVGKHQYPREVEFLDQLPKTETGKIQRFLLRQRQR